MSNAPSTITEANETCAELPVSSPQTSPSGQGVGRGTGAPGWCGLPPSAESESAQTSAKANSERLIVDSPVIEVGGRSGFAARTVHSTTEDPADLVLYRLLISQADLTGASDLCRERLLVAPDGQPAARWTKDLAIVQIIAGNSTSAFDLLASRRHTALAIGGSFAGRYEAAFGHALQLRGSFDAAFEHLTASRIYHESAGNLLNCAQTDVSTGRCYTAARNPSESHFYFDRAEQIATKFSDFHLLGEIAESRALAYEAEERFEEAEAAAWLSIQLLTGTGDKTATAESFETWNRVKRRTNATTSRKSSDGKGRA